MLSLDADEIDPRELSQRLAATPTSSTVKGEYEIDEATGQAYANPATTWTLCSADLIDAVELQPHLDWLASRLPRGLKPLGGGPELGEITVLWSSIGGYGGPTFSADSIAFLADLGLPIRFHFIHGDPVEWDEWLELLERRGSLG